MRIASYVAVGEGGSAAVENISVDVAPDGRIVMDLVGGIWVLPLEGGSAQPLDAGMLPAERPRWSPDGSAIVFEARSEQRSGLYL